MLVRLARKQHNRSKLDIIHDILSYIDEEGIASKTHILYATNLNTRSLEKFIDELLKINAINIEKIKERTYYIITPHGSKILKLLTKLKELLARRGEWRVYTSEKEIVLNVIKSKYKETTINDIQHDVLVKGYSGFKYKLEILVENTFIIYCINEEIDEDEIIHLCGRILLLLSDTNYKCLFILSRKHSYIVSSLDRILNKLGYRDRVEIVLI